VVIGGTRFVLSSLLEDSHPYLVAMVQPFEDDPGTEPGNEEMLALRELFGRYVAGLRELNDALPEEPSLPEDTVELSFYVAGGIECDLGVKQRLLVERSTAGRVKALTMLLPLLTSAIERGLKVHRRAHSNGKGGALPDVLSQ
jgi:Lon protease-like protein